MAIFIACLITDIAFPCIFLLIYYEDGNSWYVLLVKYFKRIHQEILTIKLSPSLPVVAQLERKMQSLHRTLIAQRNVIHTYL